jgi:hypothetical protein
VLGARVPETCPEAFSRRAPVTEPAGLDETAGLEEDTGFDRDAENTDCMKILFRITE